MRDEGMTAEQLSAAFPEIDFSDWDIVDETGDTEETESSYGRARLSC